MLGYDSQDELLKLSVNYTYLIPERRKEFTQSLEREVSVTDFEVQLQRKDGSTLWVSLSAKAVVDEAGKVIHYDGIMEDITERKRAEEEIRAALAEKEVLLKEIHHRVKNNLQVISSLLSLQSGYIKDKDALKIFTESQNRVRSMALIHEKLYQSKDIARIDFGEYVRDLASYLLSSYRADPDAVSVKINIEEVSLDINTAIPLALIINELVANSLEHAFPDGRRGEIVVNLVQEDTDKFKLAVADNGVGFPEGLDFQNTKSLGLQLVTMLADQLSADVEIDRSAGTTFNIRFSAREKRV